MPGLLPAEAENGRKLSAGQYSYVIITSSALAASFQPLLNQKIADGLTATIVTTNYIYANYTGTESHVNDPLGTAGVEADQIRQFIADAYANWGTRWVLLGGDTTVIPMRTVYASVHGTMDDALPTDVYYACPNGPWDSSGGTFGARRRWDWRGRHRFDARGLRRSRPRVRPPSRQFRGRRRGGLKPLAIPIPRLRPGCLPFGLETNSEVTNTDIISSALAGDLAVLRPDKLCIIGDWMGLPGRVECCQYPE